MKTLTAMIAAALILAPCAVMAEGSAPAEQAAVYEWQDAAGVVHFSDTAPGPGDGVQAVAQTVSTSSSESSPPPVGQDLVRQGYFAVKLVSALHLLSAPEDEAEAEDMLASVGIAPDVGWIADYPVTPDIAAQLRTAVGEAADKREIDLVRTEALAAFDKLSGSFGLPAAKDSGKTPSAPSKEAEDGQYVERHVVERYYYDYGPPVITYYPPPYGYVGLYAWVPFPFWWHDFYFSGYYILTDFHIVIGLPHRHGWSRFPVIHYARRGTDRFDRGRRAIISNRLFRRAYGDRDISVRPYAPEHRDRYDRPRVQEHPKNYRPTFQDQLRRENRGGWDGDRHRDREAFRGRSFGGTEHRSGRDVWAERSYGIERGGNGPFREDRGSGFGQFSRKGFDWSSSRGSRSWSGNSSGRNQHGR